MKIFIATLPLFACVTASAGDFYVGLARATPGEAYADFAQAKHVRNYNSPSAYLISAGYNWSEQLGVEAGYGDFGTWKMADPTAGSKLESRLSTSVAYAAATARMPLASDFGLFGKLGLASNRYKFSTESSVAVRPMFGFGASYAITGKLSATLEYDYFGNTGKGTQEKAALGLRYGF